MGTVQPVMCNQAELSMLRGITATAVSQALRGGAQREQFHGYVVGTAMTELVDLELGQVGVLVADRSADTGVPVHVETDTDRGRLEPTEVATADNSSGGSVTREISPGVFETRWETAYGSEIVIVVNGSAVTVNGDPVIF